MKKRSKADKKAEKERIKAEKKAEKDRIKAERKAAKEAEKEKLKELQRKKVLEQIQGKRAASIGAAKKKKENLTHKIAERKELTELKEQVTKLELLF